MKIGNFVRNTITHDIYTELLKQKRAVLDVSVHSDYIRVDDVARRPLNLMRQISILWR